MRGDLNPEIGYTKEQNGTSMSIAACEQMKERVVGLWIPVQLQSVETMQRLEGKKTVVFLWHSACRI